MRISTRRLLLVLFLTAPVSAQELHGSFRWSMQGEPHGVLRSTFSEPGEEWIEVSGRGARYRPIPSWTGDPTYEVHFRPLFSGHPTLPERVLIQLPADFLDRPFGQRAAVVGFHPYSVSEKDIFLNTSLPFECRDRGWMLIAPYGLTDLSFGNVASQASLDHVLKAIYSQVPFNYRRLYAVGFSMGGLSALSFAMRHQDPLGVRVAGVVFHSGTLDLAKLHAQGSTKVKAILEHELIMAGSPSEVPFEYARVSPVRFLAQGPVDPDHLPVLHLQEVPIYLHANLADPNAALIEDVLELERLLVMRGADVTQSLVFDAPGGHHWSTLDMHAALDVVGVGSLGAPPTAMDVTADRPVAYGAVAVNDLPWDTHARFTWSRNPAGSSASNGFALEFTRDVNELEVNSQLTALDTEQPLSFTWSSADGTGDTILVLGYLQAPSLVTIDGVPAEPREARWQKARKRLSILLSPGAQPRSVQVLP